MTDKLSSVQYGGGLTETSLTDRENGSCNNAFEANGEYTQLVMEDEEVDNGQRNTSELRNEVLLELATTANHLSHQDTIEHVQATVAVERAKERRRLVVWTHRVTQFLLYLLPTLIVICLIVYWTVGKELHWLTMVAAVMGFACIVDFILFQYFTNRVEGTDLLNTVARFRARLHKSGRRF